MSIAAILSILSFRTLRAISHLGVGKSFWIPVFVSSIFFLIGSVVTIFYELDFSLTTQIVDITQISRILALSILVCGIYSYSRRVKASLAEEFTIPDQIVEERLKVEVPVENSLEIEASTQEKRVQESRIQEISKIETAPECRHHSGYLRTLPRNASIPNECLGCDKIIKCKHSLVNTI